MTVAVRSALILFAGLFVYWPAFHGKFLWDDAFEIVKNSVLHDPAGYWKVWFNPGGLDYFPLKNEVQWVQWHLWGDGVLGYHVTNFGLHVLSAFLLWRLLGKLGLSNTAAWLGAMLFTVHPIAVESVAWISELKNVLSLPFLLLAMTAWVEWDKRPCAPAQGYKCALDSGNFVALRGSAGMEHPAPPGAGYTNPVALCGSTGMERRPSLYWSSLVFFLCAMLCKSSVVMFPFVILLYVWWRRGRIGWADFRASVPFFVVSVALGLVTVWFQFHRAIEDLVIPQGGLLSRLAAAGMAIVFYFCKCIFPVGLLPVYPRWNVNPPAVWQFLPWLAIVGVLWVLLRRRTAFGRTALFGLGFFLLNLVPVLGFIPMSYLRFSWVADHFAYVPMVGIIGLASWAFSSFFGGHAKAQNSQRSIFQSEAQKTPKDRSCETGSVLRRFLTLRALRLCVTQWYESFGCVFVTLCIVVLALSARSYASIFKEEETLWTYTLKHDPDSWPAHNNLGNILFHAGHLEEALGHFEEAVRLNPEYPEAQNNLGVALTDSGKVSEGIVHGELALKLKPDFPSAEFNLGISMAAAERLPDAIAHFERALQLEPNFPAAHNSLGVVLTKSGRLPEAIAQYKEALRLDPGFAAAHDNLAIAIKMEQDAKR